MRQPAPSQSSSSPAASTTLDEPIASCALRLVSAVAAGQQAEYKASCEQLPALLRTAGLARTLAFLLNKPGAQKLLAQHIEEQFRGVAIGPQENLIKTHVGANLATHRLHIELAHRVALWHKRIAQSLFRQKPVPAAPMTPLAGSPGDDKTSSEEPG